MWDMSRKRVDEIVIDGPVSVINRPSRSVLTMTDNKLQYVELTVQRLLGHRGATLPVKFTHALHPLASNATSTTSRNILMTNGTSCTLIHAGVVSAHFLLANNSSSRLAMALARSATVVRGIDHAFTIASMLTAAAAASRIASMPTA